MRKSLLQIAAMLYDYYNSGSVYYKTIPYYYAIILLWNIAWTNIASIIYLLGFDIFLIYDTQNNSIPVLRIALFLGAVFGLLMILIPEKEIKNIQYKKKKWKIIAINTYAILSYMILTGSLLYARP